MAKKILLVEDDVYLSNIYATKLKAANFDVITAETGQKGIDKIEEQTPDMILLDITLPGKMNGLEVLKQIKANSKTQHLPVMMLTNIKDDKTIGESLRLGSIGYFVKTTTTPNDIIKSIENFI